MLRVAPRSRRWASVSLAFLLGMLVVGPAWSDQKEELQKIEKQILELQKKKQELLARAASEGKAVDGSLSPEIMSKFKWRNIGPANMGGRVTALAVYEADPSIYYVATASGGLLKTINNGTTFTHQFDNQSTVSIGDVAVCQTNPDILWVGTGEANPRNSVSYGDGVYKSTDGGKTWTNMGLKKSFQIGKILIHPKNPNIVYVGALGRLYGANEERGLYKTTDGGKTWDRVLYVDDKTGVIDARLDPQDPEILIVAMWERKRDEFDGFFGTPPVPDSYGPVVTHGKGSGLYKSTDGGKSWKKLTDEKAKTGLPTVKIGRIGLDYSRMTKGLLFAIIDTEKVGTGDAPKQIYMGITGETVEGVGTKLEEITPNSPASKAGLKSGDIVEKADDKKVESYEAFVELIRTKKAGDKLKLAIKREGKPLTIEVTLENRPTAGGPQRGGTRGGTRTAGPARPTAGFFPTRDTDVLKIQSVTDNGPAAKAGINADDIVLSVDGKPTKTLAAYQEIIATKKAGDQVKFVVQRGSDRKEFNLVLGPPAVTQAAGPPSGGTLMPGFAPEFNFQATEVKVATLAKDSAADKAGIKPGDVVLEIDGKPVGGIRDFITGLRTSSREENPRQAGDKLKVKVKQGEKTIEAEVVLVSMDVPGFGGGRGANPDKPYGMGLGGQVANATEQGKDAVQTGGVFMSKDNGETWTRINSLNPRPMYFSVIRVDPSDDKTLYVLCDTPTPIYKSTDGGKTFSTLRTASGVHADAHALWINPKNRNQLIIGCDGGFYKSYDQGATWDHLNTMALGQFYHVAVDNRRPYRVYGGLQDNGSWGGPSNSLRSYGPINEDWVYVSGGDGFVCRVDPNDPDLVYTESQGGNINRRNLRTGERGFVRPPQRTGEPANRFNWNTPFVLSSHNPGIFYTASQFVWRSVKKGTELKKISPEITRTQAGSATALSESPVNPEVIWVGTDDGFVWVTRDFGVTWTNVSDAIKSTGVPGGRWVATLEASRDKEGRCYVCIDAHRSDDDKPYLLVTEDFGKTWKNITSNLPEFGSTRCLREDTTNADILYAGTEFGAYVSMNRGGSWIRLGANLPTVAVHEFAQPTVAGELVAATHGRSIWIVDITALRQLTSKAMKEKAALFDPGKATRWRNPDGAESPYSRTDRRFVGENPLRGVSLDYHLSENAKEISMKILDVNGKLVWNPQSSQLSRDKGFHRVVWNLTAPVPGAGLAGRGTGGGGGRGGQLSRPVAAGTYRLVLTVDGKELSQNLVVEIDPNAPRDLVALEEELPRPGEEEEEEHNDKLIEEIKELLKIHD